MRHLLLALILPLTVLAATGRVLAQDSVLDRLKALEERLKRTEEDNAKLREQLNLARPEASPGKSELEAAIDRALDDRADTGISWKQLTKSGNPIQFYGFLRLDAYFNSAAPNHPSALMWVLPENHFIASQNDDSFVFEARWTRLGLNLNAGNVLGMDLTGKIETDFANYIGGVAESRAPIRVRLAYLDADLGGFSFRFGQDWDVIAPYYPSVHLAGLMWNAGNLGDRRPQAQFSFKTDPVDDFQFMVRGALGLTGALDNQNLEELPVGVPSVQDGFDSGLPHAQLRVAVRVPEGMEFGVWGFLSALETDTSWPPPQGGTKHFSGQCLGLDWYVPLGDLFTLKGEAGLVRSLTLKGEAWIGQGLGDVRGGIGQTINPARGREIESKGGWAEVSFKASDILRFCAGASLDDPKHGDLTRGKFNLREKNFTLYMGSAHNWGGGFKTGLDVIFWETDWIDHGVGNMVRVNAYTMLSF